MNRCLPTPMRRFLMMLAIACTATYSPMPVAAQNMLRQFPPAAKRGLLELTAPPAVLMNGAPERLSPGARIKGVNNGMVMSGSLVGTRVLVNYRRDAQGQIHEVWILSPAEAKEKRIGLEPVTNFIFGSDADKPKTDDGKTPYNQLPKYPRQ